MRSYISVGAKTGAPIDPLPEENSCVGWMPEIGDRRTWGPIAFEAEHSGATIRSIRPEADLRVTGVVDYVNEAHRWYRVRYETPRGGVQHECFKF